jgi:hypothetical protein
MLFFHQPFLISVDSLFVSGMPVVLMAEEGTSLVFA